MKNFYIVANLGKERAGETAEEISCYLQEKGAKCLLHPQKSAQEGGYTRVSQLPKDTECVITIGGDGTLIQAARDLAGCRI
ncbi:MAG: NAD(+) kinase, partial [Lachnospiraceae bacterium]|nr:NAD(+) kinase [Lachnospiraceae bacterium]